VQYTCPSCLKVHAADTLAALQRAAKKCCAEPRAVKKALPKPVIVPVPFDLKLPIEYTFNRRALSQNKTTYSHWTVYKKDKTDWVKRWMLQNVFDKWVLRKSVWEIIDLRGPGDKEYDHANLIGGLKAVCDLLVRFHVIKDDAPKYFTCEYTSREHTSSGTVLRLIDGHQ
jgi:hypothetical protein